MSNPPSIREYVRSPTIYEKARARLRVAIAQAVEETDFGEIAMETAVAFHSKGQIEAQNIETRAWRKFSDRVAFLWAGIRSCDGDFYGAHVHAEHHWTQNLWREKHKIWYRERRDD